MKKYTLIVPGIMAMLLFYPYLYARSIHRPVDCSMPVIHTRWPDDKKIYTLRDYHLTEYPLFEEFDYEHIQEHALPRTYLSYRYDSTKTVSSELLIALLEKLVHDIEKLNARRKIHIPNFDVLSQRSFNTRQGAGALVLKFKEYPFVVKLFRETPATFVRPFSKGLEQQTFFSMSGGMCRYLSGFTRIKNLEITKRLLAQHPEFKDTVDFPRKWFWIPKNCRWFELIGNNIGRKTQQIILLPTVYAVIEDAIDIKEAFTLRNQQDRERALRISSSVHERIDPNIDNFVHERNTGKTVIVDTEHFPSVVGTRTLLECDGYSSYYYKLSKKFLKDSYLTSKSELRRWQYIDSIRVEDNQTIVILP